MIGEHGHSFLDPGSITQYHFWNSGFHQDTMFESYYPINPHRRGLTGLSTAFPRQASSFHPGGAMFAFADGSVRFLKDTIDSWTIDTATGDPVGTAWDASVRHYRFLPGARIPVYQALTTRKMGEVISADQF